MKILFNPNNGAVIKNVGYEGVMYFSGEEAFKPGDVVKIEDDLGKYILKIFGFIEEKSSEEAKVVIEQQKSGEFKCEECEYTTDDKMKLRGHKMHHGKKAKIDDELGIKVIEKQEKEKKSEQTDEEFNRQKEIDAQGAKDGLIGEGLISEKVGQ